VKFQIRQDLLEYVFNPTRSSLSSPFTHSALFSAVLADRLNSSDLSGGGIHTLHQPNGLSFQPLETPLLHGIWPATVTIHPQGSLPASPALLSPSLAASTSAAASLIDVGNLLENAGHAMVPLRAPPIELKLPPMPSELRAGEGEAR